MNNGVELITFKSESETKSKLSTKNDKLNGFDKSYRICCLESLCTENYLGSLTMQHSPLVRMVFAVHTFQCRQEYCEWKIVD